MFFCLGGQCGEREIQHSPAGYQVTGTLVYLMSDL